MQRTFFKFIFAVYGTLPFLCTAAIIFFRKEYSAIPVLQILLIIFQAVLIPVILGIKRRKPAFAAFICFIISTVIISLFLGEFQSSLYNTMLLKYYPGPVLTLAYTLTFRFSRFREMETMERSIRFFMLLLLSQMLMLLMISIYHTIEYSSIQILIPGITEVLNYSPALLLLNMLSVSCRKELSITENKIIYHNSDYTSIFSIVQQKILRQLCIKPVIRCRDIAVHGTACPDEDFCKATECSEYSRIYRNIQELSKKLINLGLGELTPPENKRDIVSTGWKLKLNDGISLRMRMNAPVIMSLKADIIEPLIISPRKNRTTGNKQIITLSSIFIILFGAIYLSTNIVQAVGSKISIFSLLVIVEIIIFLLPFIFNYFNKFITGLTVTTGLLLVLFFFSLYFLNEYYSFIQLNKHISLLLILLLINLQIWEKNIKISNFRAQVSVILFWSVWFQMVSATIVTPLYIIWPSILQVLDKLILYTLMILAVLFLSLPRKKLEIKGSSLYINEKPLPEGLSERNRQILIKFLNTPDKILHCRQLLTLAEDDPGSTIPSDCDKNCKSSACKPYKRLYKRIQAIQRYLESNGLGTIRNIERQPSSNTEPGWLLQLHEDIF